MKFPIYHQYTKPFLLLTTPNQGQTPTITTQTKTMHRYNSTWYETSNNYVILILCALSIITQVSADVELLQKLIAVDQDGLLINKPNACGETPLFWATLHCAEGEIVL